MSVNLTKMGEDLFEKNNNTSFVDADNFRIMTPINGSDYDNSTSLWDVFQISNISQPSPRFIPKLSKDMIFNEGHVVSVVTYSVLFVISAIGNLTIFITLKRSRHSKSRVNLLIMHLAVADLIVTFILMPLEIIWAATVAWHAGDALCRIMAFFRAFGLFLSSFVLVVISMDRYFAILHPLSLNDADRRGRIMLVIAWLTSVVCSVPQAAIFHLERHPDFPWYEQCVTFNFYPSKAHELAYNLFHMAAMYGLPLTVVICAYCAILWKIYSTSKQCKDETSEGGNRLRRSGVGNIERAKSRTLKMTIVIVVVFIMCWTPYFVMSMWYWFDRESAQRVDARLQKGLFLFAVSNSCMNPIVYGIFSLRITKELRRCCPCLKRFVRKEENESWTSHSFHSTMKSKVSFVETPSITVAVLTDDDKLSDSSWNASSDCQKTNKFYRSPQCGRSKTRETMMEMI